MSKALVCCSAGSSLALQLARNWQRQLPHALDASLHLLSYRGLGHVVAGVSLLYYWRLLERQWGSAKYGTYSCLVLATSAGAQQILAHSLRWQPSPGPTALIFANLVSFAADVPATWQGSVLGAAVSDKVCAVVCRARARFHETLLIRGHCMQAIIYVASAQLLLGASRQTLLGAALGTGLGLAWSCNLFGLQQLRVRPATGLPTCSLCHADTAACRRQMRCCAGSAGSSGVAAAQAGIQRPPSRMGRPQTPSSLLQL